MSQNYAFIDAQNLNSGLYKLGWKIDWKRFREYLREEKGVEVAYVFLGFMLGNQDLYLMLQRSGFVVVFKEILTTESGEVKGNIDAEMILQAMIDYDRYDQALIVSGDGDFTCLLRYLDQNNKLLGVLAPYEKGLSSLIQKVAVGKIEYLRSLRKKIEYRGVRDGRSRTKPMPPMKPDAGVSEIQNTVPKQKTSSSKPMGRSKNPQNPIGRTQEKVKQDTQPKIQNDTQKNDSPRKGTLYTGGTKDIQKRI
ncbi:MAG: NYN domain-containing protein [Candidatus Gracilibacteria bacterium]|nr:NYN domain-containing protein [Candidatus Gracilibacteria bacterium]